MKKWHKNGIFKAMNCEFKELWTANCWMICWVAQLFGSLNIILFGSVNSTRTICDMFRHRKKKRSRKIVSMLKSFMLQQGYKITDVYMQLIVLPKLAKVSISYTGLAWPTSSSKQTMFTEYYSFIDRLTLP